MSPASRRSAAAPAPAPPATSTWTRAGARSWASHRPWKKTCSTSVSTCGRIRAFPARSRSPTTSTAWWCARPNVRRDEQGSSKRGHSALCCSLLAGPVCHAQTVEPFDDYWWQRPRPPGPAVDQHHGDARRRRAHARAIDRLHEYVGAAADLGDSSPDLDRARPMQFLEKVDLDPRQHRGRAGHLQAVLFVPDDHHPAALQIGREHRVVDVALAVDVAEADDVGDADGKVLEPRRRRTDGPR